MNRIMHYFRKDWTISLTLLKKMLMSMIKIEEDWLFMLAQLEIGRRDKMGGVGRSLILKE